MISRSIEVAKNVKEANWKPKGLKKRQGDFPLKNLTKPDLGP